MNKQSNNFCFCCFPSPSLHFFIFFYLFLCVFFLIIIFQVGSIFATTTLMRNQQKVNLSKKKALILKIMSQTVKKISLKKKRPVNHQAQRTNQWKIKAVKQIYLI